MCGCWTRAIEYRSLWDGADHSSFSSRSIPLPLVNRLPKGPALTGTVPGRGAGGAGMASVQTSRPLSPPAFHFLVAGPFPFSDAYK